MSCCPCGIAAVDCDYHCPADVSLRVRGVFVEVREPGGAWKVVSDFSNDSREFDRAGMMEEAVRWLRFIFALRPEGSDRFLGLPTVGPIVMGKCSARAVVERLSSSGAASGD